MDKDLGILDKKYPNCSVYVQDAGELPEHVQKQWFSLWDSVIRSKFVEWFNLLNRRKPYERVDFDYNSDTGEIIVWTYKGKEFFKTKIKGIKETVLDANGNFKQERYELYRAPNGNTTFPWSTESTDSIGFEFVGSEEDPLLEDIAEPAIGFAKYVYRVTTDHLFTKEDLKEEIFKCLREMGLGEHIQKLQDFGENPDYDRRQEVVRSANGGYYTRVERNYYSNGLHTSVHIFIPGNALRQYYTYWKDPVTIDTGIESYEDGSRHCNIRAVNQYGTFADVYLEYRGRLFRQILDTSKQLAELLQTYPSLAKCTPSIKNVGSRKIIYKVAFYFKDSLLDATSKALLDKYDANHDYGSGEDRRVLFIACDKLHQVPKKVIPLLQEIEKREQEMNVLEMNRAGDTYKISSDKEKGITTVEIIGEYSTIALKRLLADTKARMSYTRTKEGDLLITIEYRWSEYADPNQLLIEVQKLEKFLNSSFNKKEKAREFDRDNWGIIYHRTPSRKNLDKSAGYFVEIENSQREDPASTQKEMKKCIDKADWDASWAPLHWGWSERGRDGNATSLFINPFWFLKQKKTYQLAMLKQGIAAVDLPYSAIDILSGVTACCRDAVKHALAGGRVHSYREKLQRIHLSDV